MRIYCCVLCYHSFFIQKIAISLFQSQSNTNLCNMNLIDFFVTIISTMYDCYLVNIDECPHDKPTIKPIERSISHFANLNCLDDSSNHICTHVSDKRNDTTTRLTNSTNMLKNYLTWSSIDVKLVRFLNIMYLPDAPPGNFHRNKRTWNSHIVIDGQWLIPVGVANDQCQK